MAETGVILTPDQRVRVFISSTLGELAEERAAARRAIRRLHLVPVWSESGASPHPPRSMYRAYLEQSQVFVGIYWQRYGWVAPGMDISGLEDEHRLAVGKPMLLYLKRPAPDREPRLAAMIDGIRAAGSVSYRAFATARELERLLADDLAVLLSESFTGAAAGPGEPGEPELPAGTVTFLLTDVEGSTWLWETVPDAMEEALERHNRLLTGVIEEHGGAVVTARGEGDSFFAVFASAAAAVEAAGACQLRLNAEAWPSGAALRVRMGLHTGEARAADRDRVDHAEPELIYQLTHLSLPADFPPIRTLSEPTGNLPVQVSSFIGRERELAEVRALAETSRLVTLTGAGGCGKTRLSLELAAGLLDGIGDGVWLVELAAISDEQAVAPGICHVLGIASQPGRPALEALMDALAPQDVVIVLDNCEHLIGGCAKTAEAIVRRCPKVRLVATSREPLGIGGETVYRVPPLSLPRPDNDDARAAESSDAVALFIERAREQGASLPVDEQTAPLVASICRRLDGLPLAIELAAARLRSLPLSSLHERLDQRFRLLTGGSRTAPGRQQTLQATVDWSYSLLHGAEQLLLRRLSVFAESFGLDAAEAVCGFGDIEAFDITGLLGSLVDKSLVAAERAGPALRYRLLETIRRFAAERLAETGETEATAVEAAHCAHYLSVAETAAPHLAGPDQGRWFARLDTDLANLRRAAEHASSRSDATAQVLRFGIALRRYRLARAQDVEALALLRPVLDRPEAQADPELFAAALVSAAVAARFADIAAALRLGDRAVKLARQLGRARLLIESLATLSAACYYAGEPKRGLPPGREAVRRARRLADDVLLGVSLADYLLCDAVADPAGARPLFTEAIACTQRSGDHLYAGYLNNCAGVQDLRAGDIAAARVHLEEAAEAQRQAGVKDLGMSINLGWVLRHDNDPDGARSSFETVLRRSRRNGDHYGIAYASLALACLAADTGDWHRAAALHGVAQAFLDRSGHPWEELEARYRRDSLDQVRARLGQEQFERVYAGGMALSSGDALDLASGKASPP